MAFVNEKTATLKRTIDYERDAILIEKGTNRENYTTFELTWKGYPIEIVAHQLYNRDEDNKVTVFWRIHSFHVVKPLEQYKKEIVKLIVEAIEAYGLFHSHDRIKEIQITFREGLQKVIDEY